MINLDDRVYLNQIIVHNGNAFYPGWYLAKQLPAQYLAHPFINKDKEMALLATPPGKITVQKIEIQNTKPPTTEASFTKVETIVGTSLPRISVNTATINELCSLKNVGTATANKIIEARPIANMAELTEKVPLTNGEWAEHEERLLFA